MSRPAVRTDEDMNLAILRRLRLVERRLAASGGGGGVSSSISPGAVLPYAGAGPLPAGFLLADGSAVSRSTYADLFSAIGTTYGSGNGTTTFNLPNYSGRVLAGLDASQSAFDAIGKVGGALEHVHWQTHGYDGDNLFVRQSTSTPVYKQGSTGVITTARAIFGRGQSSAGARMDTTEPDSSLQPYAVVRWIIAYASGGGPSVRVLANQGSTALRDAQFGVPSTDAERVALANRVVSWFNTDLGWWETYYAASGKPGLTVPGIISSWTSGWYPNQAGAILGHRGRTAGFQSTSSTPAELISASSQVRRGGVVDVDSSGIRVPVAGLYRITSRVYARGGATSFMTMQNRIDGTSVFETSTPKPNSNDQRGDASLVYPIPANSVVSWWHYSASASYAWGTTGWDGSFGEVEYISPPFAP